MKNFIQSHLSLLTSRHLAKISEQSINLSKTFLFFKEVHIKIISELSDLEKTQKSTSQELTNFKISTQNTFSTINEVVESRSGLGNKTNLADNEEIKDIKKNFVEIKKFVTENTRDQHEAQKTRDEEEE